MPATRVWYRLGSVTDEVQMSRHTISDLLPVPKSIWGHDVDQAKSNKQASSQTLETAIRMWSPHDPKIDEIETFQKLYITPSAASIRDEL